MPTIVITVSDRCIGGGAVERPSIQNKGILLNMHYVVAYSNLGS